jgi:hypothetical protein
MSGRTILKIESPTTQSIDSVKALLSWRGRAADPLPSFIEMGKEESRLVLVLNNKKDCFYVVTARDCSCPARGWHPNQVCKHQRKYFPEVKAANKPADSIMPERKAFKPFLEDEVRAAKASASPFSAIDCHDTSALDVAYHSIKMDREMWPMVDA